MTSYDDMISDANGIMYQGKYDHAASKANDKLSAFKLWNFGFKAAPKAGVSVAHSYTQQQSWDDKSKAQKEAMKNATKLGMKHDDIKFDVAAANDKYSVKMTSPIATDDWKVDGDLMWEEKPGKSRKVEANVSVESPDMSGAVAAINVGVCQDMNKEKEGWKNEKPVVSMDACINFEKDWFVGFVGEHDTEKADGLEVTAMKKDGDNKFWMGYNHSSEFAKAGCLINYADKNFTHAYEGRYNLDKDAAKGFQGLPVSLVAGGKYVLSKQTSMGYMVELAENAHSIAKWEHKIDKNWKVSATQSYDMNQVGKKEAPAPYQVGFDVAYTL